MGVWLWPVHFNKTCLSSGIIIYTVSPIFHSLSSVSGMSCAGTLGTCTHGTGIDYGLIANFVSLPQPPKKKKKYLTEHLAKCDCAITLYQPKTE